MTSIAMLGSGFIGRFYADSLQGQRSRDRIVFFIPAAKRVQKNLLPIMDVLLDNRYGKSSLPP